MSEHTLERNHFPTELFQLAIPEGHFLKTHMQSHKGEVIFQEVCRSTFSQHDTL